jgi:hypothetical protein
LGKRDPPLKKLNHLVGFEKIVGPVVALNQIGNRGFIVTQQNGKIYLLKENGTVKPGFPGRYPHAGGKSVYLGAKCADRPAGTRGRECFGRTDTHKPGWKNHFPQATAAPEPGSRFRILFDRNSLDWILVRSVNSKTAIITKDGRELFEIKDILPNSVIQYHFFGVDNRFITIKSGSYTTVFDMNGKRLGDKAIPSEMPVQLTYQPGYYKLLIFSRSEKKIQVWSIKLR